jgi:hypothetical protein
LIRAQHEVPGLGINWKASNRTSYVQTFRENSLVIRVLTKMVARALYPVYTS